MRPQSTATLRGLAAGVMLVAVISSSFARSLSFQDPEFMMEVWETEEGLPENSATAMVQTPDGYLWFGTFNGLVRFNGHEFKVFIPANTPALPSASIVNLHLDARGRMWVSTASGMARLEGAVWQTFGTEQGWSGDFARSFAERADGRLAVSTFDGRLLEFHDGRFMELPRPPGEPSGFRVFAGEPNEWWAARHDFVGRWEGTQWQAVFTNQFGKDTFGSGPAADGGFWLLDRNRLIKFRNGAETGRRTFPAIPYVPGCWSLAEDSSGHVWICTMLDGVYRVSPGGELRHWTTDAGLSYHATRFVFEDREDNLWIGTSGGGLMRFKPRRFLTYGTHSGIPERVIKSVWAAPDGSLTLATWGKSAVILQDTNVIPLPPPVPGASAWIHSVIRDRQGRTWIGSSEDGALMMDRAGYQPLPTAGNLVLALFEDSLGAVWIGGSEAVVRFADNTAQAFGRERGWSGKAVRCFAEDAAGTIWAASERGVFQFRDGRFHEVMVTRGTPLARVLCFLTETNGTVWMGTEDRGLLRWQRGQVSEVGGEPGLPVRTVSGILDDHAGHYWLASNRGVVRVARAALDRVADDPSAALACHVFTQSDGLESLECAVGQQPVCARDAQGRLWFATLKGVAMVEPRKISMQTNPPPVLIESFSYVDRHNRQHALELSGGTVRLPPGSAQFEVNYAALSYTAPEKVRFRHTLSREGKVMDEHETSRTSARASLLPPGDYVFAVHAANHDGVWSSAPAVLNVTLKSFFWQTAWFRVSAALGLVGLLGGTMWRVSHNRVRRAEETLRHERALAEARARLALTLENTSDFVGFCSPSAQVTYVNRAGRRMVGLDEESPLTGLTVREFHSPEVFRRVLDEGLATAARKGVWSGETALRHRDGHEIPVSQVILAHKDEHGEVQFYSTVMRDMTERQRAEAAVRESEERFRSLIENASDLIIVLNNRGIIRFQSPSSERVLGHPPETLTGRNGLELVHPEDRARATETLQRAVADPNSLLSTRVRVRHQDQTWRLLEMAGRSIPDKSPEGYIIINARDVTESVRLQEQFRQSQKMEAIGQLSGGVAHDFNNILAVIQGNVSLLQMTPQLAPEVSESIHEIGQAAARAANLTRQLLAFSRQQTLQPTDLDLNEVVANLMRMLQRLVGEHIEMQVRCAARALPVRADAGMVEQILLNLVVNARDALPQGGRVIIETSEADFDVVKAAAHPPARAGQFVCLTVTDNGCGIAPEVLPRIFDPFFTTKEVGKGTGLGLATVYGIVQQHEGWVTAQSEPGQGATFRVYLPRLILCGDRGAAEVVGTPSKGGGETILVVEDEPQLRTLVRRVLARQGYRILEATSGRAALALWPEHRHEIRLLLTDLVMPEGLGGLELARQLLQEKPDLKVVYTSGYSAEIAGKDASLEEGVNYLAKPFDAFQLARTIRASLDS